MAFTLKTVLDEGGVGLSVGLDLAHKFLQSQINSRRSHAKIKEFETYLNSIFYPQLTGGNANDAFIYYQNQLQAANVDVITAVLNSFDFESNSGGKGYYKGKEGIQFGSLMREIESIENILTKIHDTSNITPDIIDRVKAITERGRSVLTAAEKDLNKSKAGLKNRVIKGNYGQEAIQIANQLRGLGAAITGGISPQQAGTLFEMALQKADYYKTASEDTRNEIIEKILTDYYITGGDTAGGQKVTRGGGGINLSMGVQRHMNKIDKSFAKNFTVSDERINITYNYNPNEMKQGKMDVQMSFGGGPVSDYRVSAKRWTSKNFAHDFGSTSIDAGITRSGGYGVAEAYKFAVLNPPRDLGNGGKVNTGGAAGAAHEFAKLALKADILMGLNQGKVKSTGAGYANLLVIDTGSRIIVEDLVSLMNSKNAILKNYYPGAIEELAVISYYGLSKEMGQGRSVEYLQKMTSALNKIKVSIEYKGI